MTQNPLGPLQATILIVDDQQTSLKWLHELFRSQGYKVLLANSGELALKALPEARPDLILLDVVMPDMDGFETCALIKQDPRNRDIPIIFLSALEHVDEKVKGFNLGAVDFIQKPFAEEEVLLRVRTHQELRRLRQNLEAEVAVRTQELKDEVAAHKATEEALQTALDRNMLLMKELHHRIKNNLFMVSNLLELASQEKGATSTVEVFRKAQSRLQSLITVYELLHQSSALSEGDFSVYIKKLVESWSDIFSDSTLNIRLEYDILPVMLPISSLIPLGLIVNELLTNSLKYAFPGGGDSLIAIHLESDGSMLHLSVSDNGTGFAPESLDHHGLGWELVTALSQQLGGTWTISCLKGTTVDLRFPDPRHPS